MTPEQIRRARESSADDQSSTDSTSEVEHLDVAGRDPPDTANDLPLDVVFELLQNGRRRRVIRYLEEESATVDLGTLAEALAAAENDKPVQALTSSERKRVYICLYQCHLPKLDDAGVIEFESNRGTIERTEMAGQLTRYLDRVTDTGEDEVETGDTWAGRYLGVTLLGGGMYFLQSLTIPSVAFSNVIMAVLICGLVLVSFLHTSSG